MRISDWSSDVCSSDLIAHRLADGGGAEVEGMLDEFVGMLRGDAELPQRALRKVACVVGNDGAGLATSCSGEKVTVTGIGQDQPFFQWLPVRYQAVRRTVERPVGKECVRTC